MIKIVRDGELYQAMRTLSNGSKRIWAASPYIGRDAHNVFAASFQSATDKRLLTDVKSGCVDKTELSRLRTWAPLATRTLRSLHAKIYVFDRGAIITSANLSLTAFERNREVGVVLTGKDIGKARSAFSGLYAAGTRIDANHVNSLPERKISLGGGGGSSSNKAHTTVNIWDVSTPDPNQITHGEEPDSLAAPTSECVGSVGDLLHQRIDAELKRRNLRRVQYFEWSMGLKYTRKLYPVGALFDASYGAGTREKNWQLGKRRDIGIVKDVFNVAGHAIVVYRTAAKYRVDNVIFNAARKLHVFSGHPNAFELLDYRRRVAKRGKKTGPA